MAKVASATAAVTDVGLPTSQLEDHDRWNRDFPPVVTAIISEELYQLNISKSMVPDGIHPRVLKEKAYGKGWTPPNNLPKIVGVWEGPG